MTAGGEARSSPAVQMENVTIGRDFTFIERQFVIHPRENEETPTIGLDALLYEEATIGLKLRPTLVGREEEVRQIISLFDSHHTVLLSGLGGIGKTALAAAVANLHISQGKGPVVWMECGSVDADSQFEALGRLAGRLGYAEIERRIQTADARPQALQEFLEQASVGMLVLDNARDGEALRTLLSGLPASVPALITARLRFPVDEIVEIGELSLSAATELLSLHADRDLQSDPAASELCKLLGNHAYAVEIAGSRLKSSKQPPARLLRRLKDAPHTVEMPGGYAETGRESIKALLDDCVQDLSAEARSVLSTFGALFAPGATPELVTACLPLPVADVEDGLDELVDSSLLAYDPETDFYRLHDLTYFYAHSLLPDDQADRDAILAGVRDYMNAYAEAFDRLGMDMANVLGAAKQVSGELLVSLIAPVVMGGYPEPRAPSYMDARGHSLELLARLDDAIAAIEEKEVAGQTVLHYLLSKRGNAYSNRGNKDSAIETYRRALTVAPNTNRRVVLLGVLGAELTAQGEYGEAERCFKEGTELAEADGDSAGLIRIIEQHSWAASVIEDFHTVRDLAQKGLEVSRQLKNPAMEVAFLVNLGSAEHELGARRALAYHQEASTIADAEQDDALRSNAFYALGLDYHAMEDHEQAAKYLAQAHELFARIGHVALEEQVLAFMLQFGYRRSN